MLYRLDLFMKGVFSLAKHVRTHCPIKRRCRGGLSLWRRGGDITGGRRAEGPVSRGLRLGRGSGRMEEWPHYGAEQRTGRSLTYTYLD